MPRFGCASTIPALRSTYTAEKPLNAKTKTKYHTIDLLVKMVRPHQKTGIILLVAAPAQVLNNPTMHVEPLTDRESRWGEHEGDLTRTRITCVSGAHVSLSTRGRAL